MARKQRVDSVAAAVSVARTMGQELLPPAHNPLPSDAMPFWREIVRGRARAEWDAAPALLSTAVSLAWTQWQVAQLRGMFDGSVPIADDIKPAALATKMLDLQRLEMAYLRTLQQHGRAVVGEARDAGGRRKATGALAASMTVDDDDDLLARPGRAH